VAGSELLASLAVARDAAAPSAESLPPLSLLLPALEWRSLFSTTSWNSPRRSTCSQQAAVAQAGPAVNGWVDCVVDGGKLMRLTQPRRCNAHSGPRTGRGNRAGRSTQLQEVGPDCRGAGQRWGTTQAALVATDHRAEARQRLELVHDQRHIIQDVIKGALALVDHAKLCTAIARCVGSYAIRQQQGRRGRGQWEGHGGNHQPIRARTARGTCGRRGRMLATTLTNLASKKQRRHHCCWQQLDQVPAGTAHGAWAGGRARPTLRDAARSSFRACTGACGC